MIGLAGDGRCWQRKQKKGASIGLQSGAPLTNLCARAFKFEKESDRSRHDELKYRSSVCRGDMGEDREIGASVLAGVRAARPPSPEEPRCSVRRVSAGRGHLTRRGQAWSDGNGGRARSLAALARGALARLPSLRCACAARGLVLAAVPAPARPGGVWRRARGGSRASVSRFVSSSSPSNTQSLPSTSLRTCSFFPSRQTHMRFVSRVSFRRLGCDFAQVCEITGACVILRSHEITHPGVKSQPPAKSYPGV